MTKPDKKERIEQFKEFAEKVHSYPWGKDSKIDFHSDTSRVVIHTDIGLITYYMTTGKLQIKSHIFNIPTSGAIYRFLDQLFTVGTYMIRPYWSSRKSEQDLNFLSKVKHPFVERKKKCPK